MEEYNFIDKNGECNTEWICSIGQFNHGYARVMREDESYNYVSLKGEYLSNVWFCTATDFFDDGLAKVGRKNKYGSTEYNIITTKGNLLSPNGWFYSIDGFQTDVAVVRNSDGYWNFLRKDGTLLSDEWFFDIEDDIYFYGDECGGYVEVTKMDGTKTFIDLNTYKEKD